MSFPQLKVPSTSPAASISRYSSCNSNLFIYVHTYIYMHFRAQAKILECFVLALAYLSSLTTGLLAEASVSVYLF